MSTVSKNNLSATLSAVLKGVTTTLLNKTAVLEAKAWKGKDIASTIQAQIDALQAADAAHATWLKLVADQRAAYTSVIVPLLKALRNYIANVYGTNSETYLAFGFVSPTKAKPSIPTQSAALEQRLATRKARGTLGKRQRLAIKGVVPPVTALPVVATPPPASAAPPTAPLPPAASPGSSSGSNGTSH